MDDSSLGWNMSKAVGIICMMLCLSSMAGIVSPVSAQILPEVILECDDDVEIDPSPGSTRTGLVNCVAENPSMFSETIDIALQSEQLASAAPGTITLAAGSSTDFQVSLRSDEAEPPGEILVNITATITQVNGVPYPAGDSDEEEITVTIIEYSSCETEIGQGGGNFDSGDEISISASIKCESNEDGKITYQIHLIEKNMGSSSWPSGFQNIDGDCDVDIDAGDSGENCNFRIGTPSDLEKDWEGCIVIIEKGDVKPNLCPNTNKVDLKIKKKAVGLGIEFGGNESILEQLGITEEQVPVIAGSIGILILIIGGFVYYRRKGQEYEYE
ncbi:MAG: hypothetical protein NLN66_05200 [Candidatus Thalassarchaeaceae archaeon]|nr:hypothetical protein [Candidatus Thalassarchaeaceae archaeon]